MEDEAISMNKILKGRQLVWLIHDWFRLNPEMKQVYGLQAITDLQWYGDDKISEFMDMWKLVDEQLVRDDRAAEGRHPRGEDGDFEGVSPGHRLLAEVTAR